MRMNVVTGALSLTLLFGSLNLFLNARNSRGRLMVP
jgi:hypothetical protein